ncbi:hypothetical protein [Ornithinibacillus sp. FSL M8-0202]|uniref:hypothetical protein n=1 Tax=Ornithinibacillus sp. FSL M8-0202 TaxID=2921616 RepID=UPI0030D5B6B4
MQAANTGKRIEVTMDFVEASILTEVMRAYVRQNPDAIDADIVREMSNTLSNPQVKIRK